ncbi:Protein CBG23851 [Caenorhabditis briggsae]|uniref:Decapping nuclease n=1 Tax=Caenorhabditis briggsae TaxID=6238 RepID=A8WJF8_CAEBR|nr:Protein CBG23851 [Caenorhabditis briggsae]CAP20600.2 Protein CBG23851 [Caenorhabditis briggsae]
MKSIIQVKTIRYFRAGSSENSPSPEPALPPTLNNNQNFIKNPKHFPFLNLNLETSEVLSESSDSFELFLKQIQENGAPEFVTQKNVLTRIATSSDPSSESSEGIRVFRKSGVTFLWSGEKQEEDCCQKKYEKLFKDYFLGTSEQKVFGIFEATIPGGAKVYYFGEVDGRDANQQHLAFRVVRYATTTLNFWKEKSCEFFWDCVFGNVPILMLGTRTGTMDDDPKTREPLCYSELSVYKLENLPQESIPSLASTFADKSKGKFVPWSIMDGESELQEFFRLVQATVTQEDAFFTFSKNGSSWKIKNVTANDMDYCDLISTIFSN